MIFHLSDLILWSYFLLNCYNYGSFRILKNRWILIFQSLKGLLKFVASVFIFRYSNAFSSLISQLDWQVEISVADFIFRWRVTRLITDSGAISFVLNYSLWKPASIIDVIFWINSCSTILFLPIWWQFNFLVLCFLYWRDTKNA